MIATMLLFKVKIAMLKFNVRSALPFVDVKAAASWQAPSGFSTLSPTPLLFRPTLVLDHKLRLRRCSFESCTCISSSHYTVYNKSLLCQTPATLGTIQFRVIYTPCMCHVYPRHGNILPHGL